jgi:hypothetical protein
VKRKRRQQDPRTPAEWQEAVDDATGWRLVADCMLYGLLEGGPTIHVERCDDIIRRGSARGFHPSRPAHELALLAIAAHNEVVLPPGNPHGLKEA